MGKIDESDDESSSSDDVPIRGLFDSSSDEEDTVKKIDTPKEIKHKKKHDKKPLIDTEFIKKLKDLEGKTDHGENCKGESSDKKEPITGSDYDLKGYDPNSLKDM